MNRRNSGRVIRPSGAYDVFTSDIARDIAHAPGTMQVAFKPDPRWDRSGGSEFVTEALIPVSHTTAQRAESDAQKVPRGCARSLSAQYSPAGQPAEPPVAEGKLRRRRADRDLPVGLEQACGQHRGRAA
jgi:hypothetical protein